MSIRTTRDMSDSHEGHVAEVLGGRVTRNSGATWKDQGDGKHGHRSSAYEMAWDCKATAMGSLSVRFTDWEKIKEQGQGAEPAIPVRFYEPGIRGEVRADLILVSLETFAEMREAANRMALLEDVGCLEGVHDFEPQESGSVPGMMVKNGPCRGCGQPPYSAVVQPSDE